MRIVNNTVKSVKKWWNKISDISRELNTPDELGTIAQLVDSYQALPPADKENEVALAVYSIWKKAQPTFDKHHRQGDLHWGYYKGEIRPKRAKFKTNTNMNVVFSGIETIKPTVQGALVIPVLSTEDQDQSETLNLRVANIWRDSGIMGSGKHSEKIMDNLMMRGTNYFKVVHKANLRGGTGDFSIISIQNRRISFDIRAKDDFFSADWVADTTMGSIGETRRIYKTGKEYSGRLHIDDNPFKDDNVDPVGDGENSDDYMNVTRQVDLPAGGTETSNTTASRIPSPFDRGGLFSDMESVLRVEMWYWDLTEDDKGDLVYPHGRVVTIGIGADSSGNPKKSKENNTGFPPLMILNDMPNPYTKLAETEHIFPFVQVQAHNVGTIMGMSEVAQRIDNQKLLNDALNLTHDNWRANNSPKTIISKRSGLFNSYRNVPGFKGEVEAEDVRRAVHVIAPTPIAHESVPIVSMYRSIDEQVSGNADVVAGRQPGGVTAGNAIQALQSKASGRFIKLSKQINNGYVDIYKIVAYCVLQFDSLYDEPITLRNDEVDSESKDKYVQYDPQENDPDLEFKVEVSRKLTQQEVFTLLELAARLEVDGGIPGLGELAMGYTDDKNFYNKYIQIVEEFKELQEKEKADQLAAADKINQEQISSQLAISAMAAKSQRDVSNNNRSKSESQ